jgi:four helix bundle protein
MPHEDGKPKYDLEERTAQFGEAIIDFALQIQRTPVNEPLISQIVRSGTSVGANYVEADDASSKKDFRYRIAICKRESRETKFWLRMIGRGNPDKVEEARKLWIEAKELHLIFAKIWRR